MSLTQSALRERQIAGEAPARRLRVAGRVEEFARVSGGYVANGGSVIEIEGAELSGAEGERVLLDIGYGGRLLNFWTGEIESVDDESGTATCHGPLKILGSQALLTQVNYGGYSIGHVLMDLAYNPSYGSRMPPGSLEVRSGGAFVVGRTPALGEAEDPGSIFPLETTRLEVAEAVTASAGFHLGERPGYRVLAMPTPRPEGGSTAGKPKAVYTEDHYPVGGLAIPGTRRNLFAGVLVFRRLEGGTGYGAYAYAPVENRGRVKPPKNRVYLIPEFVGSDEEAGRVAYDTSRALAHGARPGTISGLGADPTILMHDTVDIHRRKEERGDRFEERYRCRVDSGVGLDLSSETQDMELGFSALLVERKLVPFSAFFGAEESAVVSW